MDRISVFLAIVRPLALFVGALGALLIARDPALAPQAVARNAGPSTVRRGRAILWLILTGLIAAPFRVLLTEIAAWISILPRPERLRPVPVGSLLLSLGAIAGLLFGFGLTWLLLRRLEVQAVQVRTGWRPSPMQRVFLWLALGLFLAWPVALPIQIVGVGVGWRGLADLAAWQGWFGIVQSIVGYGLALWAAGNILRRVGSHWQPYFKRPGRLTAAILLVTATGLLADGLLQFFQVVNAVIGALVSVIGAGPASGQVAALILDGLPALVYLLAIPVVRSIDWEAIAARTGWRPSALDEVLVYLALAAWLAWPFSLPSLVVRSVLPTLAPGLVLAFPHVVLAAVVVIVLYLVLLYVPSRKQEEPVKG
jgi:hypothetical protein